MEAVSTTRVAHSISPMPSSLTASAHQVPALSSSPAASLVASGSQRCGTPELTLPMGMPSSVQEAQDRVELLFQRFSVLFAELHHQDVERKSAEKRNEELAMQLAELKRIEAQSAAHGRLEIEGRRSKVAEARQEAQAAEEQAAQGAGEADALTAAAAQLRCQAERLRERCRSEVSREQRLGEQLRQRAAQFRELQMQHSDYNRKLEVAEKERQAVADELQQVAQGTTQAVGQLNSLEKQLEAERMHSEQLDQDVLAQRDELYTIEHELEAVHTQGDDLFHEIQAEKAKAQVEEGQLVRLTEEASQTEEELREVAGHLRELQDDEARSKRALDETLHEAARLRDLIQRERREFCQQQDQVDVLQRTEDMVREKLLTADTQAQQDEREVTTLQARSQELGEKCATQKAWEEELLTQQKASQDALARLRAELQVLQHDRKKLQEEVDLLTKERIGLEVELESYVPALQEGHRRCQTLEGRLTARSRELVDEEERTRRAQAEAEHARAKLQSFQRVRLEPVVSRGPSPCASARQLHGSAPPSPCRPAFERMPAPPMSVAPSSASLWARADWRPGRESCGPGPSRRSSPEKHLPCGTGCQKGSPGRGMQAFFQPAPREPAAAEPYSWDTGSQVPTRDLSSRPAPTWSSSRQGAGGGAALGAAPWAPGEDPIRFLCEFVAKEEERLAAGLPPRSQGHSDLSMHRLGA